MNTNGTWYYRATRLSGIIIIILNKTESYQIDFKIIIIILNKKGIWFIVMCP